jgi:hypothetical protein
MATAGHQRLSEAWKVTLDRPLTTDESYRAIHKGGGRKSPGRDEISNEFLKKPGRTERGNEEIFTQMLVEHKLAELQKR